MLEDGRNVISLHFHFSHRKGAPVLTQASAGDADIFNVHECFIDDTQVSLLYEGYTYLQDNIYKNKRTCPDF